jgi:hypothetical protein
MDNRNPLSIKNEDGDKQSLGRPNKGRLKMRICNTDIKVVLMGI